MATNAQKKRPAWAEKGHALTLSAITRAARRTSQRQARSRWYKLVPIAVVVLGLFLAWRYTPLAEMITAQNVVKWARRVGRMHWSAVFVVIAYIVAAFIMFPRPLLTLLSIIAYGAWAGFGVAMVGIVGSAVAVYYAGRALPESTLHDLGGEKLEGVGKTLRKHGVLAALAVSIVPVAPFPLVGMTAGAAGMKLWQFLTGVTLGMLPGTIATAVFTTEVLAALDDEGEVNYWIVAGVIAVFAVLFVIVKRWFAKHHG